MSNAALKLDTHDIVIDDVFPHAPEKIWKTLTTGDLIGRWLMPATGFAPVEGTRFTFKTTSAGGWDGTIHCQVLEVIPNQRLVHSWKGGHQSNIGYGAPLDTLVTWTLSKGEGGTRIRLVHSGFVLPRNEGAYKNMGDGWKKIVKTIDTLTAEQNASRKPH